MSKIGRLSLCALMVFAVASITLVGAQTPEPGPEHERLNYFVGKWTSKGQVNENSIGMPAGKFTGKDTCEWFDGKFAVVCHNEGSGPMGTHTGIGIMSYSSMNDTYTYYGTDSMGMAMTTIPHGNVDGKIWVYNDEADMGGVTVTNRYIIEEKSKNSYSFKWEIQDPEGNWVTIMEGVTKRA